MFFIDHLLLARASALRVLTRDITIIVLRFFAYAGWLFAQCGLHPSDLPFLWFLVVVSIPKIFRSCFLIKTRHSNEFAVSFVGSSDFCFSPNIFPSLLVIAPC